MNTTSNKSCDRKEYKTIWTIWKKKSKKKRNETEEKKKRGRAKIIKIRNETKDAEISYE